VFNCPFCDGWEQRGRPVVVIDAAPGADHLATLVRSWTPHVTFVKAAEVRALAGDGTTLSRVTLRDGRTIAARAAFVKAAVVPRSSIARALGCELDDDGYITNETGATSHPLVWAAGDVRRPPPTPHQVVLAAADGSTAAIAIHKTFVTHKPWTLGRRSARLVLRACSPAHLTVGRRRLARELTDLRTRRSPAPLATGQARGQQTRDVVRDVTRTHKASLSTNIAAPDTSTSRASANAARASSQCASASAGRAIATRPSAEEGHH
jgi:pyruvate/2-oxoglutarate dehydrogenase complex dihydrolipoamide dehydrogenase (E3) component